MSTPNPAFFELVNRLQKAIENKMSLVFFDESDNTEMRDDCYYIDIDYYESMIEFILKGVDDNEIARYDFDREVVENSADLRESLVTIMVETINTDIIQREFTKTAELARNKHMIKNIKKSLAS